MCRAAHPEGEVHIRAGGGVEGEKVLVRCTGLMRATGEHEPTE